MVTSGDFQQLVQRAKIRTQSNMLATKTFIRLGKNLGLSAQQTASPLFSLPLEIRELVWQLALAPSPSGRPAHFHVYDKVHTSCTYVNHDSSDGRVRHWNRVNGKQMSLLLTCRAIQQEAQHFLWETSEFTLVVLAGSARPWVNVNRRNNLGQLKDCKELFLRMRTVNLVVQAGKIPNAPKFAARIVEVLRVLDFGQRLTRLKLSFNFHQYMEMWDRNSERKSTIVAAFEPLREHLRAPMESGKLQLQIVAPSSSSGRSPDDVSTVHDFLGLPEPDTWGPVSRVERRVSWKGEPKDICQQRGAYGSEGAHRRQLHQSRPPPTNGERVKKELVDLAYLATSVFLSPVVVPAAFGAIVYMKVIKGEW
ncbi:hypothetical protein LTR37_017447 [Vermiconidia calcicola]|uniref:Uncharacterized protein n=1 Tax=Vermiconidia calcicola TaxID=1690605 RepID=A0ACC3MK39_9PEZI|nr:hypothetical protein LTR37_017447 [Vermiconidia calcicola]